MTILDVEFDALGGGPAALNRYRGNAVLVVNMASACGLHPQQIDPQDGSLVAAVEKLLPR